MRTTNKGMAQLRHAHYMAKEFCRHGTNELTRNVYITWTEAMQIEQALKTVRMPPHIFDLWADAQDRVFQTVIRLGYGVSEVRTGK